MLYRILASITLALAITATGVVSQDVAPKEAPDTSVLLSRLLNSTNKETKAKLRKQLAEVSVNDLRSAAKNLSYADIDKRPISGIIEYETTCPDGYKRPYWVYVPRNYDPKRAYPMVVMLHGGVSMAPLQSKRGSPGRSMALSFARNLGQYDDDVIVVGASSGPRQTSAKAIWWFDEGRSNVLHFTHEARKRFNTDPARVFLGGHSDGASGAIAMAARQPGAYAGYFVLEGHPLVVSSQGQFVFPENFKGTRMFVVTGDKDQLYPTRQIKPMFEQFKKLGGDVEIKSFPNLTHDIRPKMSEITQYIAREYLLKPAKHSVPTSIDWTATKGAMERDWVCVEAFGDITPKNAPPENETLRITGRRVTLGVYLDEEAESPTVLSVVSKSVADNMGIEDGDVIVKLDDTDIEDREDLVDALAKKSPGDDVRITVERKDGKTKVKKVLEGTFPKARPMPWQMAPEHGRVQVSFKDATITVKTRGVKTLRLRISDSMLKDGKVSLVVNGKPTIKNVEVKPSRVMVLKQIECGHYAAPYIAEIIVNIAPTDEPPKKKETPDEQQDDEDF